MSGFWESELGEVSGKPEDAFVKSFTLIADNTMALARIDKFTNDEYSGNKFLKIEWMITEGDYSGAKVEQKLKVWGDNRDKDPVRTRHRALNMLKLLYQLYDIKPKHSEDPTDADLAIFAGKIAGIKIRETEPNEQGRQYNWVSEIHAPKGFKSETGTKLVVTRTPNAPIESAFSRNQQVELENDVPF